MSTVNVVDVAASQPAIVKKVIRRRPAAKATVATPAVVADTTTTPTPTTTTPTTIPDVVEVPVVTDAAATADIKNLPNAIENEVIESGADTVAAAAVVAPKKKTVKGANKERLFNEFESLTKTLEEHLLKNNMKSTMKELKSVRDMTYRLLKLKTVEKQKRDSNNSGFMKPVRVSGELEAFLQKNNIYKPDLTRAYLTTVLCNYIKTHNLQNPDDKRIIFPDEELQKLFSGDSSNEPLTYYSLQKRIQVHIFKN